jgi:hypothetical protein
VARSPPNAHHWPRGPEKSHEISFRMVDVPADVPIGYLWNICEKSYRWSEFLSKFISFLTDFSLFKKMVLCIKYTSFLSSVLICKVLFVVCVEYSRK